MSPQFLRPCLFPSIPAADGHSFCVCLLSKASDIKCHNNTAALFDHITKLKTVIRIRRTKHVVRLEQYVKERI